MTHRSDETFLALHVVKVRGFASTDAVADAMVTTLGADPGSATTLLERLCEDSLVTYREGRVCGWRATPEGAAKHAELIRADLAGERAAAVERAHRSFVPLNGTFKQTCTDWQLRDGEPNDHTDGSYDRQVIAQLEHVHLEAAAILAGLEGVARRFGWYRPRLDSALDRVRTGDRRAFAMPLSDSYHDVWMELHQDFILSLDLTRTAADA